MIEDAYPDASETTAVFEGPTVREIGFEDDDASGTVWIREYGNVTGDVPPLPGDLRVISASIITVPSAQRETPAVVRAVVDPERLRAKNVVPDRLGVYRLPSGGDEWHALPTETFGVDDGILVEAETPGFSQFVIAGPATPGLIGSDATPASASKTPDPDGANGVRDVMRRLSGSYVLETVGISRPTAALLALLAVVAVIARIFIPRGRR